MRWTALVCALVAVLTATKGHLVLRLTRNLFTPGVPRAIEPRYPLVLDETLARDITVVVGTKDSVTPTQTQLAHLATALPLGVRVIYTYPEPLFEEAEAYADKLRAAAGPLAKRLKLLPVSTFANPFAAWLKAAPFIKTKYTLLMHNDVFLLDDRGHFLSELYGALETDPDVTVAAPQIYETEFEGLLTTHLFNTNLHLRLHPTTGVAMMSHEVDLVTGTSREPGDFAQRMNRNFLEDHVFLVRSEHVDGTFIDPDAAFTLEYVDLQLNMLRKNLTQLYVPTARAEFRLWEFGWQDVPYFVRRRSEEQARKTKQHLETKWGVQFPNTGFCNFVKFSVIRHVDLDWTNLPPRWVDQAGLVVSWFEMAGFNRHGDAALADLGEDHTLDELLLRLKAGKTVAGGSTPNASAGLVLASRRELVSTAEVQPTAWQHTGIGDILHFQESNVRMETRYQVEHMSLAVLRVPLGAGSLFDRERVRPLCGLLLRTKGLDECWIYVAPHRYDHPIIQAVEWMLYQMRVGPRVALGISMKLTNSELTPGRYDAQLQLLSEAGVRVSMCGEHHWRCSVQYEFPRDGRLLHWSGRMHSWPKVVRTLLPRAEELHGLYAAMALLVCLGAAATASSATAAKAAVAVLCLDYVAVLLGLQAAHAAVLWWASRTALVRPVWRRLLTGAWLLSLCLVNTEVISRYEALAFATFVVTLCALRRLRVAVLTLRANHKPSLLLPLLSRLTGSLNSSPSHKHALLAAVPQHGPFYRLDGAPPAVAARRAAAMAALRARVVVRWPRASELCSALCGAHREAMPVEVELRAEGAPDATPGARKGAWGKAGNKPAASPPRVAAPPPGSRVESQPAEAVTVRAVRTEAGRLLQRLAKKEAVHFYLSGSEALMAAARLCRANTGRPLLVVFGGAAHGWVDGGAAEGLALGEERYACDVLTLRDQSTATLALLYLRREEIAAVVVNPLCGLLSAPAPAAEGAEPAAAEGDAACGDAACGDAAATPYGVWLAELRAACTRAAIPLIFDEASTGFRVAAGGAQQHFGVEADIVCFGHTLGDGLPVGAVCGSAAVLASSEPHLPLRKGVEGGEGGVADHPALMASVLGHLKRLQREPGAFAALHARVAAWGAQTNAELAAARLPLRLACAASVWSLRFEAAGRYHWVLQPLLREEGVQLAWLAPGHLGFALDTSEAELDQMSEAILRAARRMRTDGWWPEPTEVAPQTDAQVMLQLGLEVLLAIASRLERALAELLPAPRLRAALKRALRT